MNSSQVLLDKIHRCLTSINAVLKDNSLTAEVQISDINTFSWGLIELVLKFNQAIAAELSDVE
jgi:hypothetical protein